MSFVFAASAAAIGLGNIWRFPYMVGQNGGGLFVITYLICVLILGIPLVLCEILLGRAGQSNPAQSFATVARLSHRSRHWGIAGLLSVFASFFVLTYYTVIAGWVIDYTLRAFFGSFAHITPAYSQATFYALKHSPWQMIITTTLVIFAAFSINLAGIKKGLERVVMLLFPILLLLLLVLLGLAIIHGHFHQALLFLFDFKSDAINMKTILLALGQAFFSLNIGMGVTIMFSAYLPRRLHSISATLSIALADTGFALLSGLIIFPFVFAYHLTPSAGPSLIFQTLPLAFGGLPYGSLIATLFFLMLFFAAFSSIIALFEPSIAWLIDTFGWSRLKATAVACSTCWGFSGLTIASFHSGWSYFTVIDFITAAILLPIGGLLTAIFCGWRIRPIIITEYLHWQTQGGWYTLWRAALRFIVPLAIVGIFLVATRVI